MPISSRTVIRGMLRKGFRLTESRHRRFRYYKLNGERTRVVTLTSHGADSDLNDRVLAKMARQLRLTRRQFDDLIECRLSQADYEAMLRRDRIIR